MIMVFLCGCENGHIATPQASGRPYEVLVVMDKQEWEAPEGRALFDVLDTDIPGLPQPERSFHISQVAPKDMNRTLSIFRNIIEVDIDPTQYTQTRMKFVRNVYAQDQVILRIRSGSKEDFAQYVTEHGQDIIDFFTKMEMNRLCRILSKKYSKLTFDLAREIFDCELRAPEELKNFKRGKDFLWTTNNTATGMVSIMMYSYPYEGPETFNKRYMLHKRDSVLRINMPGSDPDMFMQTDTAFTAIRPIVVHHKYAMEARGLWFMHGSPRTLVHAQRRYGRSVRQPFACRHREQPRCRGRGLRVCPREDEARTDAPHGGLALHAAPARGTGVGDRDGRRRRRGQR